MEPINIRDKSRSVANKLFLC